jgi:hypothetical protein
MEDPALEDECPNEILAELYRARAELRAMSPAERAANKRRVREEMRTLGVTVIDSEDHPMHPRAVRRRMAEQGYVWVPPAVPPPRTM